MQIVKQYGTTDGGFFRAAKATGRFMYECREEYRRYIGVNPTASLATIREGQGRVPRRFLASTDDD